MPIVAENDAIRIIQLDVGSGMVSNAYLMVCKETNESVIIDTPGDAASIIKQASGTEVKYLLITHNHWDHLGGLTGVKEALSVPVAAHRLDGGQLPVSVDIDLADGDVIRFGKVELLVLHTPGHTPGSVCFVAGEYLVSGDTLFPHGPGRTGSPEALAQIIESINDKLLGLADETQIFSGHGEPTVLKSERDEIAVFHSRPHSPGLCGDVLWLSS